MSLSALEQKLIITCLVNGQVVDLASDVPVGEKLTLSNALKWDRSHEIKAKKLQQILLGHYTDICKANQHGIRLRGIRVTGRLDLENLDTSVPIEFDYCHIPDGISGTSSTLQKLVISNCIITSASSTENAVISLENAVIKDTLSIKATEIKAENGVALNADGVKIVNDAELQSTFVASSRDGAIAIRGAHVGGSINLGGAKIQSKFGPALSADRVKVTGNILLGNMSKAVGSGTLGTLRLTSATIGGILLLDTAEIINDSGPALSADRLSVGGSVYCRSKFNASGTGENGSIRLVGAQLGHQIIFQDATVVNTSGAAIIATKINLLRSDFLIQDSALTSIKGLDGCLILKGASLGADFRILSTEIKNDKGPAISADGINISRNLVIDNRCSIEGQNAQGSLLIMDSKIGSNALFSCKFVENTIGPSLQSEGINVSGSLVCKKPFKAMGSGEEGTLKFTGARIDGKADFAGASIINSSGPALLADGIRIGSGMNLGGGFFAKGEGPLGTINIESAQIGAHLSLDNATLNNCSGPSFLGDNLSVTNDLLFKSEFCAVCSSEDGAIRLTNSTVGGRVKFAVGTIRNNSGPAIFADRLEVKNSVEVKGKYIGHGEKGTIRFFGSSIQGRFDFLDAQVNNRDGSAFIGDRISVGGSFNFDKLCRFSGAGEDGTLHLPQAVINGEFSISASLLSNTSGPILNANSITVFNYLSIDGKIKCAKLFDRAAILLLNARVGVLHLSKSLINSDSGTITWEIDGATFGIESTSEIVNLLQILQHHTIRYAAQPYQHLAKLAREAGHDGEAREVQRAQRQDQLLRGSPGNSDRIWGFITRITVGYGYRPWYSLVWLISVFFVFWILLVTVFPAGLKPVDPTSFSESRLSCNANEYFRFAVDTVIPLISTGVVQDCNINSGTKFGDILSVIIVFTKMISWSLVTLFAAGFTKIVRRN